jgi:hypothetical protein
MSARVDAPELAEVTFADWLGMDGIDLRWFTVPDEDRVDLFNLVTMLRVCCGALVNDAGRISAQPDRRRWRRLRDCPEVELVAAARRVERLSGGRWRLPESGSATVLDRIDRYLRATFVDG